MPDNNETTNYELATMSAAPVYALECMSTIGADTVEDKKRALRAKNAAGSLARRFEPGEPFEVVDILQTRGTMRSRQMGVPDKPCINTYFLLSDGTAVMSQSSGIAESAQDLMSLFPGLGRDTEDGCMLVTISEQKLDNGNIVKKVVPV